MLNRRIAVAVLSLCLGELSYAQSWTSSSPNIYFTGGNVGIGTSTPSQPLEVIGNALAGAFAVGGAPPSGYQFFATSSAPSVSTAFQLRSNYAFMSTSYVGNFGAFGTYISHNREPQLGGFVDAAAPPNQINAGQIVVGDTQRSRLFQVTSYVWTGNPQTLVESPWLVVKYNGNVGIGTVAPAEKLDVQGNINVSGNINAKYQDVAEWVPATSDLEPGTVVVLNPGRENEVMASTRAYDTTVAGVVSAQPGLTLGEKGATKETVATMGRVRVRADARHAPIAVGDLLVTSDRPGVAMKSLPIDVAGFSIHRPGTIIGKALQPLPAGEGEILVLLSLQ